MFHGRKIPDDYPFFVEYCLTFYQLLRLREALNSAVSRANRINLVAWPEDKPVFSLLACLHPGKLSGAFQAHTLVEDPPSKTFKEEER